GGSGRLVRRPVPPVQHPQRSERVPPTRRPDLLEVEPHPAWVDAVEEPPAVGLPLGPHDLSGLGHPWIGSRAGTAEIVERPEQVVAPVVREGELEVGGIDALAGALAAEQVSLEQILLTAPSSLAQVG